MSDVPEVSVIEDLRNYAILRDPKGAIFDNGESNNFNIKFIYF